MAPRKSSAGTSAKVTMYRPSAKAPKGPTALTKGTTKVVIVKDGGRGGKSLSRSAKTGRFTSSTYRAFISPVIPPVQPTPLALATSAPAPAGHPDPLVRSRAARDLADLDYRRAVQADPATQTEAARRLGTSQANISKLRARAAEPIREGFSGASPHEVCLRHAAGQITDEQLVDELTRWDYAPGDYRTDGFTADLAQTPGSFDDVLDAMYDKLIPRDLYAVVAKALTEEDLPQRQW